LSQVLQEQNSNGDVKVNYIFGLGLIASIDSADNIIYYHFNADGNTTLLTDDSSNVTDTYSYEPFGSILNHTGSAIQPYCFLGKYGVQVESDGRYYIRARYYDAIAGRFLSKDLYPFSIDNLQTLNRFVYGLNNPLLLRDVTGLYGNKDGLNSFNYLNYLDLYYSNLINRFYVNIDASITWGPQIAFDGFGRGIALNLGSEQLLSFNSKLSIDSNGKLIVTNSPLKLKDKGEPSIIEQEYSIYGVSNKWYSTSQNGNKTKLSERHGLSAGNLSQGEEINYKDNANYYYSEYVPLNFNISALIGIHGNISLGLKTNSK
jgi:RHS repeat-associated protein